MDMALSRANHTLLLRPTVITCGTRPFRRHRFTCTAMSRVIKWRTEKYRLLAAGEFQELIRELAPELPRYGENRPRTAKKFNV